VARVCHAAGHASSEVAAARSLRERFSAAMATVGLRARPAGMLFTGASVIAAINSIVGGVGVALLAAKVGHLAASAALSVGIAAAVVVASAKGKGLPLCRLEPVDRLRGLPRRGWGGDPQGCDRPRAGFLPVGAGSFESRCGQYPR
jgi:hypothetical protein